MFHAEISEQPIDLTAIWARLADPGCGAQNIFVGLVRDHDQGRPVAKLGYSAHPSAVDQLQKLVAEVAGEFNLNRVLAIHRTGELEIGDVAVVAAVATAHRDTAFQATRVLIDRLKTEIPIWKNQHFLDGDSAWVGSPTTLEP